LRPAAVDFVDIDPRTCNMSADALAANWRRRKRSGITEDRRAGAFRRTVLRHAADLRAASATASASSRMRARESVAIPERTCWRLPLLRYRRVQFSSRQIITPGGRGRVTNDPDLAERMARLRSHGTTARPEPNGSGSDGPWYYQLRELGWNYRMTTFRRRLVAADDVLDDNVRRARRSRTLQPHARQ